MDLTYNNDNGKIQVVCKGWEEQFETCIEMNSIRQL